METVAWSCHGCGALVEPYLVHCHRCGARKLGLTPEPVEAPPAGTPAEFVTAVHRASIEPRPAHGPIAETAPAATEMVSGAAAGTVPETPIYVPPPRAPVPAQPPPEVGPQRTSRGCLWLALIPLAIAVGVVVAYFTVDAVEITLDGIVEGIADAL